MRVRGPQAHVQAVGSRLLKEARDLLVLFDGGALGIASEVLVAALDAVDENLHHEVRPARLLDALDDFHGEPRAALDGLRAVFVLAVVAGAREERLSQVVCGKVELEGVEAIFFQSFRDVDDYLLP